MITFITGPVSCGKTANLLIKYYNMKSRRKEDDIVLITHETIGDMSIKTRLSDKNMKVDYVVSGECDIERDLEKYRYIFVDEIQFFSEKEVLSLLRLSVDRDIYCYGIKTNQYGELFKGAEVLLRYADDIVNCNTQCSRCDSEYANCSEKIVPDDREIDIGHDKYIPVCKKCFLRM